MKRIYLQYNLYNTYEYHSIKNSRTNTIELYILLLSLQPENQDNRENVDITDRRVFIWSDYSFKEVEEKEFISWQEKERFEKAYQNYFDKRWDEMPHIKLSHQDYENILKQWEDIKKRKPKYLIFELDNSGPLDKVTIIEKEGLSDQDYENMKRDHEEYLRWEKAKEKYIEAHPDYSDDLWRGPQDDEYDADIAQFLDKD